MSQSIPLFRSELLSRTEAASYLGVSARTLAVWKSTGRYNLPCIRIGRLAKYRKATWTLSSHDALSALNQRSRPQLDA